MTYLTARRKVIGLASSLALLGALAAGAQSQAAPHPGVSNTLSTAHFWNDLQLEFLLATPGRGCVTTCSGWIAAMMHASSTG
ncbi:hypothetical protein [Halomonas sp. BC04]|uniref:hypothetical protein n=1 Tax=Halomonas sp. BC04 TaxID=1403540 RepID=UPI0004B99AD9|nr:hypothetical protein [Halomonas sp. BC04]